MSFQSLGLIEPIQQTLEKLGYNDPTPVQKQAIPAVLAGRDLMAAAQTGTGKTAGFALPILQRLILDGVTSPQSVRCLVLVPTRELAEQVYDSFRTYGGNLPLRSFVAYGGVPIEPQISKLRKGLDVLVATPGRLLDLLDQGAIRFDAMQTLVLDEADRMLDLGFARELDIFFAAIPATRQTLLFSATFSDQIRAMARAILKDPVSVEVSPRNTASKTVKQWLVTTDKRRKPELFLHLYKKRRFGQTLVFVKTRKGVDQLVELLLDEGISAEAIHGDKAQHLRLRALDRFKTAQVKVLVATDVAARGLDIDNLPLVVNFDLPSVAEDYVHRIGRTGRAGAQGEAISLVCADEADLLAAIEKLIGQAIRREEEAGFEADHRVPETSSGAVKSKTAANNAAKAADTAAGKKKRPFTGPAGGKAAQAPRPAGSGGQGRATGSGTVRGAGPGAGGRSATLPKGAVIVTSGRGAKSAAKAAAKAVARKPAGRGSR